VTIAAAEPDVHATVGVHPHEAASVTDATIDALEALSRAPRVVAIGETGLDYHYEHSPRAAQREAFARFIQLARRRGLPLSVHLRNADDDAVEVLRGEGADAVGGVIHCFSSDVDAARRFLDLGFHISFSGIVTFKTADELRAAARLVPRDRLLIETDAPFLAPIPFRGRRNEPALVLKTAALLAEVRGEPLPDLAAATSANTRRLFALNC
jgi:TatD DNase family protein